MRKEVKPTNLFESVKSRVPVPLAAERYGVQADRKGRCRCPFHPDKTPSMQLNKTYYYCFGCHCTGEVIDFTGRLLGLSPLEAARKLAADFGIDPNTPASAAAPLPRIRRSESPRTREGRCACVLMAYERLLKRRQQRFAPVHPSGDWDTRFVSASHALPQVSFLIDCLYEPDEALRKAVADSLIEDGTLRKIERWNVAHREDVTGDDTARAA